MPAAAMASATTTFGLTTQHPPYRHACHDAIAVRRLGIEPTPYRTFDSAPMTTRRVR